ncbi:unnamed protein product [Candida verbasci]|uniref:Uncharacterized protein n=1 Tax=Candida verbasci TaxID=1227364 RepID=A0A9W4XJD3_9ASCO|nr:unnamed protein product [Candida verbasci]
MHKSSHNAKTYSSALNKIKSEGFRTLSPIGFKSSPFSKKNKLEFTPIKSKTQLQELKNLIEEKSKPLAISSPSGPSSKRSLTLTSPAKFISDFDKEEDNRSIGTIRESPEFTPRKIEKPNLISIHDSMDDTFDISQSKKKKRRLQLWKSETSIGKLLEDDQLNTLNYYMDDNIDMLSPISNKSLKSKADDDGVKPKKKQKNVFRINQ